LKTAYTKNCRAHTPTQFFFFFLLSSQKFFCITRPNSVFSRSVLYPSPFKKIGGTSLSEKKKKEPEVVIGRQHKNRFFSFIKKSHFPPLSHLRAVRFYSPPLPPPERPRWRWWRTNSPSSRMCVRSCGGPFLPFPYPFCPPRGGAPAPTGVCVAALHRPLRLLDRA
jgi:hypothetical protein